MTARERPILFSAPMVRAILTGNKTQTRRVVNLNRHYQIEERDDGSLWPWMYDDDRASDSWLACPYGMPGDRLWVKEQTIKVEDRGWIGPVYTESDEGRQAMDWGYGEPDDPDHIPPHAIKRRPSLFMTRAMSRITLEVTEVRVERLQDISESDAIAEGGTETMRGWWTHEGLQWNDPGPNHRFGATPIDSYRVLWESINGPGSWGANPWVWAINFKRLA